MRTARFKVLGQEEVERIHAASMEVLATVGVKVEWGPARKIFGEAGAGVDDDAQCVRIPEKLVRWAIGQAPEQFKRERAPVREVTRRTVKSRSKVIPLVLVLGACVVLWAVLNFTFTRTEYAPPTVLSMDDFYYDSVEVIVTP